MQGVSGFGAVRVRPAVVTLITAQDLNVVLQRLEQTLPGSSLTLAGEIEVGYTDSGNGDRILWYERK
jgi:hypothetical protein